MRNTITRVLVGLLFIATAACGGGDDGGDDGGGDDKPDAAPPAPEFDNWQEFSYVVADVACEINEKCDKLMGKTVEQCKADSRTAINTFCGNAMYSQYCAMTISAADRQKFLACYDANKAAACDATDAPQACKDLAPQMP